MKLFGSWSCLDWDTQILGRSWLPVTQGGEPGVALLRLMQQLQADGSVNAEQNLAQGLHLCIVIENFLLVCNFATYVFQ